ncbi:Variant-specific surface protein [Giardia duodenalis]|uniref:Variant-specific surface protein n=1 Tax=Giardia intestinalis TaxID=5741 RepID=V6TZS0_GIAIN|nr:Variant-specific surface protein [Giardia intestinalis]
MAIFIGLMGVILSACIHTAGSNQNIGLCAEDKCTVLGGQYCAECATPGEVPINGACIPIADPRTIASGCEDSAGASLGSSAQKCGFCRGENYFLHEGGCYSILFSPGNSICSNAVSGYCTACADGFFSNTVSSVTQCQACDTTCATCSGGTAQSCLSCQTDRFLVNNECKECSDQASTGIEHCAQCAQKSGTLTCTVCKEQYFLSAGKCASCASNCATCTSAKPEDCTVCVSKYSYDLATKACVQTCEEHASDQLNARQTCAPR